MTMKRLRPRAKGRADRILKRSCHITVQLSYHSQSCRWRRLRFRRRPHGSESTSNRYPLRYC
jgi:hypothetical protein